MLVPSIKQIRKGILRPERALIRLFLSDMEPDYNPEGVNVFQEDWDNLIILDACRYDTFEKRSSLPGELESRISRGAATPEWLRGNFRERDLLDTVYVTANPMFHKHKDKLETDFHDVWHLWKDDRGWDQDLQTVPPSVTAKYAQEAANDYPNKRLLIHFNQPHGPLLGPTAEQSIIGPGAKPTHERSFFEDFRHVIKFRRISTAEFRQAYTETFDLVHESVEDLLPELQGKTVVSADHGEMLGERLWPIPIRLLSHYQGYYKDPLINVPWHIYENGERREIKRGSAIESDATSSVNSDEVVKNRLEDLGYLQT